MWRRDVWLYNSCVQNIKKHVYSTWIPRIVDSCEKKHITNFCRLNPRWNRHFLVESHIEQWQIAVGTRSKTFQNNQPPGCQKRSLRWEITSFWQENSPSHYPSPVSLFTYSDENQHFCWTLYFVKNQTFDTSMIKYASPGWVPPWAVENLEVGTIFIANYRYFAPPNSTN